MSKRYSPAGYPQISIEVGENDLVRGATWVRASDAIETPVGDVDVYIADSVAIVGIIILTDGGPGDCEVDIWRAGYASFPPTVADTIFASALPEIVGGDKYADSVLAGVSVNCSAGDVLRFHLVASSTFTRVSVFLIMRPL